jgi:hypothetical protein
MSSMDAPTLEFFIADSFHGPPLTEAQFKQLVTLLEPHREAIERQMREDYDPEEHSWRDYRNSMWYGLEHLDPAIDKILGRT